ncbi:heme oxygenase [Deinococcus ficus]|nr:heme oxygenase [Deinococcus ficus]
MLSGILGEVTLLQRLKDETSSEHAALEARLPLMHPDLTLQDYVGVLQAFYSVVQPLEARLDALVLPEALEWPERRRAALLEADLRGLDQAPVPPDPGSAQAWADLTGAEALGACYVLEGSTLGGQLITRQLGRLGLSAEDGGAYFAGHGVHTGARWKAFRAALESSVPAEQADAVLRGARRTFLAFHGALA